MLIHTKSQVIAIRETMKNMEQKLSKFYFERCNVSYLVNLAHVSAITGDIAVAGGELLPISRQKRKSFIAALESVFCFIAAFFFAVIILKIRKREAFYCTVWAYFLTEVTSQIAMPLVDAVLPGAYGKLFLLGKVIFYCLSIALVSCFAVKEGRGCVVHICHRFCICRDLW